MKQIALKTVFLFVASLFVFSNSLFAQKREKSERIIIQKKGGKDEKIIIEIEGDKIKINGKLVDKEGDSNIIIRKFNVDDNVVIRLPKDLEFRIPQLPYPEFGPHGGIKEFRNRQRDLERFGKDWQQQSGEFKNKMYEFKDKFESRAFLGVGTDKDEKGLRITEVQKESAAAKAGLKENDIITKVDGETVSELEALVQIIRKHKPDEEVTITYLRNGKQQTTKAKLTSVNMVEDFDFKFDFPEMKEFRFDKKFDFEYLQPWKNDHYNGDLLWFHNRPQLGATIQDTEDGKGVTVLEVDENSAAAKSGLKVNDLITEVNGKKVNNVAEARETLREKNEKNLWTVQVLRDGKPITIEIKIPKQLNKTEL